MTTLGSGGSRDDSDLAENVESNTSFLTPASKGAVRSKIVVVGEGTREWSGDAITVERGKEFYHSETRKTGTGRD